MAQESFERLKGLLVSAPLLRPPNYHRDYTLYLAAVDTTIGMVLVQTDDDDTVHVIYYLSRNLLDTEARYAYVEKLALAVVCAVQRFRHYILLRTTTVISDCNPMTYILSRQLLGGKYSKWIVILQEFDLEFATAKSKKSLVFAELFCSLPSSSSPSHTEDQIPDETLFLISTLDRGTMTSLYICKRPPFTRVCLKTLGEGFVINLNHIVSLGIPYIASASTLFSAVVLLTRKLSESSMTATQIFQRKMRAPPAPLHPIVTVGPFAKWGIDYVTCNPRSAGGHGFIIVAVDYFTKWVEVMPTLTEDGHTATQFLFNHVISRFGVPQAIVTDHGKHFRNHMMRELTTQLGLKHDSSTPYYPQSNGQVEAINKILVTMLQRTVGMHKSNWNLMLFPTLWAYRTSLKDATGFTPFQLVYGLEATLPIECEIPSLRLAVELLPNTTPLEERLLYLERLDGTRRLANLAIETQKKRVKSHFDQTIHPRSFNEGDLVLLYDQANDKLGPGKLESMWLGPYIVKKVLQKGAYELIDYEGNPLAQPRNGLYLKKYYA
eukprot:PITA_15303